MAGSMDGVSVNPAADIAIPGQRSRHRSSTNFAAVTCSRDSLFLRTWPFRSRYAIRHHPGLSSMTPPTVVFRNRDAMTIATGRCVTVHCKVRCWLRYSRGAAEKEDAARAPSGMYQK